MKISFVALPFALLFAGCSDTYWSDRGRDALDIFDVSASRGLFVGGNVGVLGTGLGVATDVAGLRGGEIGYGPYGRGFSEYGMFFVVGSGETAWRHYVAGRGDDEVWHTGKWEYRAALIPVVPALYKDRSASSYTQCGVTLAPLCGLHLGFNPGELLDFACGWFGADIYGDDATTRPYWGEDAP